MQKQSTKYLLVHSRHNVPYSLRYCYEQHNGPSESSKQKHTVQRNTFFMQLSLKLKLGGGVSNGLK
jgi:hypothetical protein